MWKTLLMLETKGTSRNVFWRRCAGTVNPSMLMTVVDVGKVRMFVAYRLMHMPMRVRLTTVIRSVLVLVMFIVDVPVMMGKGLVRVIMYMALGKVKPDTDPHHRKRPADAGFQRRKNHRSGPRNNRRSAGH